MIPNPENWSIVLIGSWNPMIFRPEWLRGRLTETENISIELLIGSPMLSQRFGFDKLYLLVQENRLVISPENSEDEILEHIQEISIKILKELPHTPLQAVGINFQFYTEKPPSDLLKLFDAVDIKKFKIKGFKVKTSSIQRQLKAKKEIINLKLKLIENQIIIDFNFHRDIKDTKEAKKFLGKGVIYFKNQAVNIIQNIYNGNL